MSLKLLEVAKRAQRDPEGRLQSLAHLIDEEALERSYRRLRKRAAVGVDGVTKERYGEDLEGNLRALHQRLKQQRYRHQPLRRVHIPKGNGRTRKIGVAALEDKIVQGAVHEILEAAYEPLFVEGSYGFRPGRSAHDALRALLRAVDKGGKVRWILEADIATFFDSIDRKQLMSMLEERIADKSLLRLIGKCLHVGVLDGEEYSDPDRGTPQGSSLSPILGNIYLHYALDRWVEQEVKPRMQGELVLIRYADDVVLGFEHRGDAERVLAVLGKRLERFGLRLHPDKTRLFPFGRPPRGGGRGKARGRETFDLLGFTWYWRRSRLGGWHAALKTRRGRMRRAITSIDEYCRRHRHEPVAVQHRALIVRLQGHYNYFGVNGNVQSLEVLAFHARRTWHKWLCRRSQKAYIPWERFNDLLRDFPLPKPRVCVQIWGSAS
jgi:group II intron reverse transcriptase/maturase